MDSNYKKLIDEAIKDMESWPEWKRSIKITKYSGLTEIERQKLIDDEHDAWLDGRHFGGCSW
jgi:hypothetical protein